MTRSSNRNIALQYWGSSTLGHLFKRDEIKSTRHRKDMLYCVSVTLFVPNIHSEVLLELIDNGNWSNVCQTPNVQFYIHEKLMYAVFIFFRDKWNVQLIFQLYHTANDKRPDLVNVAQTKNWATIINATLSFKDDPDSSQYFHCLERCFSCTYFCFILT